MEVPDLINDVKKEFNDEMDFRSVVASIICKDIMEIYIIGEDIYE